MVLLTLTTGVLAMPYLTVSDVAAELNVPPRLISDLLYARRLDVDRCPVVGGRRLIPREYLPVIRRVVREVREEREGRGTAAAVS